MQIRPGGLILYDQHAPRFSSRQEPDIIPEASAGTQRLYSGKLSEFARGNLKFAINLLIEQAKWKTMINPTTKNEYRFKVNFITLTLSAPQGNVSDKEIKSQMLGPWLRIMRDTFKLRSYVWRAERQKNGNIHFHFVTDTFILYSDIRDNWNHQQAKFHFINDFRNRNNSEFPNSTDVHSVINIRNLAAYIVKYMSKDERGLDSIEGKVWDCSSNLKTKERCAFEMSGADFSMIDKLHNKFPERFLKSDRCTVVRLSNSEMFGILPPQYVKSYRAWIQNIYDTAPVSRYSDAFLSTYDNFEL